MTFILAAAIFWAVLVGLVLWAGWHDMHELAERNENVNELSEASHGGSATRGLRVKR